MLGNLKEKIFSYGIFGTPCSELNEEELFTLLNEQWVEFVTGEQIAELHSSFTTLALDSKQKEILKYFEERRMTGAKKIDYGRCELYGPMNELANRYAAVNSLNSIDGRLNYGCTAEYDAVDKEAYAIGLQLSCEDKYILRLLLGNLYVRMNTVAWKEYLTNGSFNFTSKEYYYVFDMLIRMNEYVSVANLRATLNIEPKKMFYIIKKLACLGYIDKTVEDNKIVVRIRRDAHGDVVKGQQKEKRRSINSEDTTTDMSTTNSFEEKHIGMDILIGVPLITQLKNFIEGSRTGVCSKDIQDRFGIKLKIGLKLLNKITDKMEGSIKTVEEFEGKIKRTKFYNVNELSKLKERKRQRMIAREQGANEEGITMEDRINAIEQILDVKKAFVLDKEVFKDFKSILGCRYTLDRRTVINAAIKGGFNVYKLHDDAQGAKFVIAHKDVQQDDPLVLNYYSPKRTAVSLTPFQAQIHKFFVTNSRFTEIDNGFEPSMNRRVKALYLFIERVKDNEFYFDCDLLRFMSLGLFFKLVSFKRYKFLAELVEIIKTRRSAQHDSCDKTMHRTAKKVSNGGIYAEENDDRVSTGVEAPLGERNGCEYGYNESPEKENIHKGNAAGSSIAVARTIDFLGGAPDQETVHILNLPMEEIFNMEFCTDYMKLLRMKYEIKAFLPYLVLMNDLKVIHLEHDENTVKVTKKSATPEFWMHVNQETNADVHLDISEREEFFEKCKMIEEKRFYRECLFVINRDYDAERAKILSARLTALKKQVPSVCDSNLSKVPFLPQILYEQYVDVKKDLVLKGQINIKKYNFTDLETILKFMRDKRIICEYKACASTIELTSTFKKKVSTKMDNIALPDMPEHLKERKDEMHIYHTKYLHLAYYVLVRAGSLDVDRLSEKMAVLEAFELLKLVKHFDTLFNTKVINEKTIVSIGEGDKVRLKFL
ncbi:hypothetical protein VCUG_00351 [Vavraia culicis subsp. floridensis]|uniref:Uncharacterized protein n=1 Tax=Vavraia culicis (isolate floridensis) TaxID=948595 RepID=L2GXT3_VAVCU|nr:uncharacterized protein VCUG_00351 [Vavraia culicis subsp. floridensis]ELA48113.1 hypothetical protein VCUG_00351 [Vavraia culicis subsp. floridensis]